MATYPTQYAHPEALVETDWLEKHLNDEGIRIVESNEDILLYDTGHIPGAVHIDWRADLQDPVIRDYISPEKFARLCSRHGITPNTICIFYGDKANWWACYARWASTGARSRICRNIRRKASCAAATFPGQRACRGRQLQMTTRHSNPRMSWPKFILINAA